MGEYATRLADGVKIKIGTCESMYYLRLEDVGKVLALPGNVNPRTDTDLLFRPPWPDEDDVQPGEYQPHQRYERLYKLDDKDMAEDFSDPEIAADPGTIQLRHPSGLSVNAKCFHGVRLPNGSDEIRCCWNGKSWSLGLAALKRTAEGVLPVIGCRHCGNMWRYTWEDVWPFLQDEMRERLAKYYERTEA